jgi:hypothetical protein
MRLEFFSRHIDYGAWNSSAPNVGASGPVAATYLDFENWKRAFTFLKTCLAAPVEEASSEVESHAATCLLRF